MAAYPESVGARRRLGFALGDYVVHEIRDAALEIRHPKWLIALGMIITGGYGLFISSLPFVSIGGLRKFETRNGGRIPNCFAMRLQAGRGVEEFRYFDPVGISQPGDAVGIAAGAHADGPGGGAKGSNRRVGWIACGGTGVWEFFSPAVEW